MTENGVLRESESNPPQLDEELLKIATELGLRETEEMRQDWNSVDALTLTEEIATSLCASYNNGLLDLPQPKSTQSGMPLKAGILIAMGAMAYRCGFKDDARDYIDDALDHLQDQKTIDNLERLINQYFPLT